jgi:hypothetical protein
MASSGKYSHEPVLLIAQLHQLTSRLTDQDDIEAKKECLQLSKALTLQLEQPENVALDLAFSICFLSALDPPWR